MYLMRNKPQSEMTANPGKYPQGFFKVKACRECGLSFQPQAPSHLSCSQNCADRMLASRYLMRNYGIDLRRYELMLKAQKDKCAICRGVGFRMAEHHKMMLVVDHCHETGTVRGLLCHNCNRGLGLFKDSAQALRRAQSYLNASAKTYGHGPAADCKNSSPMIQEGLDFS